VSALESKMKKVQASADDDGFVRPVLYATNSGGFATDDDGFACSLGEEEQDVEDEDVDVSPSGSRDGVCPRHTDLAKNHGLQFGKNAMRKRISITEALIPYWRIWVYNAVTHPRFDMALASAIMANAVVLCFEVQYNGLQVGFDLQYQKYRADAKTVWPGADITFIVLDYMFGLLFIAELILKVASSGPWRYMRDAWNWLDVLCVFAFLIDKIGSAFLPMKVSLLRLLRLFRLIRLVRLFRSLETFDVLHIMTTSIRGTKMILLWAILLLSVMLMMCALFITQILHSTFFSETASAHLDEAGLKKQQKLYEYFGTFTRCFLSMFELTLANWPPVTRLLQEELSEWCMALCLVHKLTIGFAVVGVINGVILQETFKVAATDDVIMVRQKKKAVEILQKKMQALFRALDHSEDGELSFEEFDVIASHPDVRLWLASMDIETDDMRTLFMLIDVDDGGTVTPDELMKRVPRLRGAARSVDVLALKRMVESLITLHGPNSGMIMAD